MTICHKIIDMNNTIENKFYAKLKELREDNNLSQEKLAKLLHCNQSTIAKWETGDREPSLDFLCQIAKHFDVTTDYLLGLED